MEQRYARLVKSAALAATALASSLLLIKIVAWYHTGSVSLLAALVDSLVDIAASLTNLLVVRYSLQPADAEHAFGHGKAESLAALAQSMFISGSALFLFLTGFQHLYAPQTLRDPGVGVVVTVIALISTLILVTYQRWVVRKTRSQAVRADMLHYQSDVMMNGAILIALGLSWYGFHRADALFALGIGVYILYSALRMGYEAVQSLLDRALPDDQQQRPVEHQVDEIGLRAVGGTDQVQLVVVFAVAHRERPDQLDAAVLFLLGMIRIIGLADEVADDLHFVALRADHPAFAGDQQQALARRRPFVDGAEQAAPPHQIVGRIVLQLGLDVLFQHQPLPLLAVEQRGHLAGVELGHHQHQH